MALGGWLVFVGAPLYNLVLLDDTRNISKQSEKNFIKSKLFVIPLYSIVFASLLTHAYCLVLFSTNYQSEHWLFALKPETNVQYLLFGATLSFFHALSGLAAHELIHEKAWYNKIIGTIPYT